MNNKIINGIVLMLILTLSSCDKTEFLSGSMSSEIDGDSWSAATQVTVLKNDIFAIVGTSIGGQILEITIVGSSTGTYELDATGAKAGCASIYKPSVSGESENFASTSGIVELTEVTDETISGTFEFSLTNTSLNNSIEIIDGTFDDIPYTNKDE